jgi:hypothetical protein
MTSPDAQTFTVQFPAVCSTMIIPSLPGTNAQRSRSSQIGTRQGSVDGGHKSTSHAAVPPPAFEPPVPVPLAPPTDAVLPEGAELPVEALAPPTPAPEPVELAASESTIV